MIFVNENHFKPFSECDAIALCDENGVLEKLTYKEVEVFSNQISEMISRNIREENICLALKMSHNIYVPSIIISLKRMGHAFMFLNEYDADFEIILKRLGVVWLLSFDSLPETCVDNIFFHENSSLSLYKMFTDLSPVVYRNICYIIKTSGTTGISKCVRVDEFCIENNIKSLSDKFQIKETDVVYFGTPLTFDPSMVELFLSLYNGACLLIAPLKKCINPDCLFKILFQSPFSITFLQIVPSLFLRWSENQISEILSRSTLKILAFGGESFPDEILMQKRGSQLRIFNLYGITEISCWASVCEIEGDFGDVPIGEALGDTLIEVRDSSGREITEELCEGEIYLGSGTRFCYVDEETRHENLPVYRKTGDLGVLKKTGIFFSGRTNNIVKRFGHKINLSEIEKIIYRETKLSNKCIWFKAQLKLLTFVIIKDFDVNTKDKIIDKIRVKLLHALPKESFPDYFEIIAKIPVTSHGKINQKSLESYYLQHNQLKFENSCDLFKKLILKYFGLDEHRWNCILKLNFFELGGNSIVSIQFLTEFLNLLNSEWFPGLTTALLENNLEDCLEILKTCKISHKRSNQESTSNSSDIKKIKTNTKFAIKWMYNLEACVDASPIIFKHRERILTAVGSFSRIFAVLEATTGEELAKFILPDNIESSAALSKCTNFLYVGCFDGKLYCLDFVNRNIKWEFPTGDSIKSKACVCGDFIAFGSYDKHVYYITNDGNFVWKTLVGESIKSDLLLDDDLDKIFVATIAGTCLCLSRKSGEKLWMYKSDAPILGSGCILNNLILLPNVTGNVLCLSLEGKRNWLYSSRSQLYSSLIKYDNETLIFACYNSDLCLLKCKSQSFEILVEFNLGRQTLSTSPVLINNNDKYVVIAVNKGTLFLVDLSRKSILSEFSLQNEIFSSPANFDDKIYIGCRDNNLYCIHIN